VLRTRVGYAGGTTIAPTYRRIGDHSESLEVDFDPDRLSYAELVDLFWASHNPTRAAHSRQYQAILFFHDDEQQAVAQTAMKRVERGLGRFVTTELRPLERFWRAEDYHQKYYLRAVRDLAGEFAAMYPEEDNFVDSTAAARVNGYVSGHGNPARVIAELPLLGLSPAAGRRLLDLVAGR